MARLCRRGPPGLSTRNGVVNRPVVEVGGNFADGLFLFDGRFHGVETFVSFGKKAVKLLQGQGVTALFVKKP